MTLQILGHVVEPYVYVYVENVNRLINEMNTYDTNVLQVEEEKSGF